MKHQALGQTVSSFAKFNSGVGVLNLIHFHQFPFIHRSITFPFARGKFLIAENKYPKLPQTAAPEGASLLDTVSSLCPVLMSRML